VLYLSIGRPPAFQLAPPTRSGPLASQSKETSRAIGLVVRENRNDADSFFPSAFLRFIFLFRSASSGICPSHFAPKSWKPDKRDMAGAEGTKMKEPPAAEQDRVDIFRVTKVKNGTETRKLQQKWSTTWQLNGSIADCSHKSPLFDYKTADRFLLLCLLVLMCGASTRFRS
jgi:hypothetical protein